MGKRDRPLDAYRRVRKPVPPPGRAIPDRRRQLQEEQRKRDTEEEIADADKDQGRE